MQSYLLECPKCRGSMLVEEDSYGAYSTCLSCGYVHEYRSDSTELVTNKSTAKEGQITDDEEWPYGGEERTIDRMRRQGADQISMFLDWVDLPCGCRYTIEEPRLRIYGCIEHEDNTTDHTFIGEIT